MISRPWGSLALVAVAAFYALLSVVSGTDRASLRSEVSGRVVPAPLRAQLYRQDARLALQQGRLEEAALAAARAIRSEPSEPGSTAVLGAALFAKKDYGGADRAYRVAGKLGWRDLPTQAYLMLAALAVDERALAAERLDAIMRVAPDLPAVQGAITVMERDKRGRTAMLARLAENPVWLTPYAVNAAGLPPSAFANRLTLLEKSAARQRRPACKALTDPINALAFEQNRFDDARRLWAVGCADNSDGNPVSNASFARDAGETASPFDWTLPGAGGVSAAIEQGALVARNDDLIRRAVAHQYLLLPAGDVEIAWDATASGDGATLADAIHLLCPDGNSALEPASRSTAFYQRTFTIVPGCRPQRIEIRLDRAAGDVRVEAVRATLKSARQP